MEAPLEGYVPDKYADWHDTFWDSITNKFAEHCRVTATGCDLFVPGWRLIDAVIKVGASAQEKVQAVYELSPVEASEQLAKRRFVYFWTDDDHGIGFLELSAEMSVALAESNVQFLEEELAMWG